LSSLTKIFVVLLVLSSMLLTSAIVVYVNREQNWKKLLDDSQAALALAQKSQKAAEADAVAAKAARSEAVAGQKSERETLTQQLTGKDQVISQLNVQVAELNSKNNLQAADIARLSDGLKSSQETQQRQQDIIVEARKSGDELTKRNTELNNKLDVTTREWRFFKEQLAEAQKQVADLGKVLKDHGIEIKLALASAVGVRGGAPSINGVVKDVRPIEGVPYATISVGSADSVTKGMRFQVIDRDRGEFLGFLVVDTVESNEASGKLDGPKIAEIKAGTEVRTQL
jgi:hypothetical protein